MGAVSYAATPRSPIASGRETGENGLADCRPGRRGPGFGHLDTSTEDLGHSAKAAARQMRPVPDGTRPRGPNGVTSRPSALRDSRQRFLQYLCGGLKPDECAVQRPDELTTRALWERPEEDGLKKRPQESSKRLVLHVL